MLKNRAPYDAEVDAEVAKEYQRIQDEKRKVRPDHGAEIEAIRTRMTDVEGSVTRLGENVAALQKRMEDMMRMILQNQSQKHPSAIESLTEPSSSAQIPAFSVLTSTTEQLMLVAQKQAAAEVLNAVGGADMRLASAIHVPSDVSEDAVKDAATDVQEVPPSSEGIIASIIGDILEVGKNTTQTPAIVVPVEPTHEEVPVQAMEDVEEGHPEISANADVPEEIASLEQVISSKTHPY
jgi:hypothetical protein